jgi:three-Cys-motif partner protein
MPSSKANLVTWAAEPHTLAKISLLSYYLNLYFQIIGRTWKGEVFYIDGFAGPGEYSNSATGSPIAALESALEVRTQLGSLWKIRQITFVFIEDDPLRFKNLKSRLQPYENDRHIRVLLFQGKFNEVVTSLHQSMPQLLSGYAHKFWFVDPFGPTGIPFEQIRKILSAPRSELLINLDADGVRRIYHAKEHAKALQNLTALFGSDSWQDVLSFQDDAEASYGKVKELYRKSLRSIPGVDYVFPFEMRDTRNTLSYYLMFASKSETGLRKMKEAMRTIDRDGGYRFWGGDLKQEVLFRFDDPKQAAEEMYQKLLQPKWRSRKWSMKQLNQYALNMSPFTDSKRMLKILEERNLIEVTSNNANRRVGTFPDKQVITVVFKD